MKKFSTLYLVPLLSVCLIALKQPAVEKWINGSDESSLVPNVAVALAACTLLVHFFTVIIPYKKHNQFEKNKLTIVDAISSTLLSDEWLSNYHLTVNILLPKRKFYNNYEPHELLDNENRTRWFKKVFKPIWVSENSSYNKKLKLTTRQGVSGLAYETGKLIIKDFTLDGLDGLNLTQKQKDLISSMRFIISCPIYAFNSHNNRPDKNKIIGILNLSSSTPGSDSVIKDLLKRKYLTEKAERLSRVCGLIM